MTRLGKWLEGRRVSRLAVRYSFTIAEVERAADICQRNLKNAETVLYLCRRDTRTLDQMIESMNAFARKLSGLR